MRPPMAMAFGVKAFPRAGRGGVKEIEREMFGKSSIHELTHNGMMIFCFSLLSTPFR